MVVEMSLAVTCVLADTVLSVGLSSADDVTLSGVIVSSVHFVYQPY